jgi:hypothetical protein
MKIAMWSGPRNLSTAMMYAFGNRHDFTAMDEPFYAAYLHATGAKHPMAAEILSTYETDPATVAALCAAPQARHLYMKHMSHHMLPGFPLDWAAACTHVHLIRHPARVIASYGAKRDQITADDIGFRQQTEIHARLGGFVIDSADVRASPQIMLEKLCTAIGLAFDPAMLAWPAGPRPYDGVWAKHWYGAVHASTGFAVAEGPIPVLTGRDVALASEALPHYQRLAARKL